MDEKCVKGTTRLWFVIVSEKGSLTALNTFHTTHYGTQRQARQQKAAGMD